MNKTYKATYVRAKRGKKLIHILTPYAANVISLCRFAENVELAEKDDAPMCSVCKKIADFLVTTGSLVL
jgi:hypothetical protein